MAGFFITLEGGEGAGKTTHGKRLVEWLQGQGHDVVTCREPGGTAGGLEIRSLLVTGEPDRWLPVTEMFLLSAGRYDNAERLVKPALAAGKVVISDRWCDSTYVYQGYGYSVPHDDILAIQKIAINGAVPDLTLVFDVDAETALMRSKGSSKGEDRYEKLGHDYHQRIQTGYRELVKLNPQRCVLVNAMQPLDAVFDDIIAIVSARLLNKAA